MCVLKVMLPLTINTDTECAKGNYCPLKISMQSVYSNPYHHLHYYHPVTLARNWLLSTLY